MSGGGSQKSNSTTVQRTEPWAGAKPFLEDVYGAARGTYRTADMTPFGAMPYQQRMQAATRMIGFDPRDMGQDYGGGQAVDLALRTGQAAFTPQQLDAQRMMAQLGRQGSSGLYGQAGNTLGRVMNDPLGVQGRQAAGYYGDVLAGQALPAQMMQQTAGGAFLGSNPYLDQMYQAMTRPVVEQFQTAIMPGMDARFSRSGAFGSPEHGFYARQAQDQLGRNLSETAAGLYGQAYESERGRMEAARANLAGLYGQAAGGLGGLGEAAAGSMIRAGGLAPGVAGAQLQDQLQRIGALGQAGADQQAMVQALADRFAGTYGQMQQAPWQELGMYSDIVGGLPSSSMGSSSQVTPYYQNRMAGLAGGAMGGAALGSMLGPYGMAGGAVLGGLLGGWM